MTFFKNEKAAFDLIPASIYGSLRSNTSWVSIPKWEQFEVGSYALDTDQLLYLFETLNFDYKYCDFIIVTDEEWKDSTGFSLQQTDLFEFISRYEDYRKMDFLQPLDYIFFNLTTTELLLIHHEGKAVKLIA